MRKWSPTEVITLTVSAAILGGSIYYIAGDFRPSHAPVIESRTVLVGTVKNRVNDVRRKHDNDPLFTDVSRDMPIFDRDAVFTGESSNAEVSLKTGADLKIAPNSLVVITLKKEGTSDLALKLGSFLAKIRPGSSLMLGGAKAEAKSGHVVALMNKASMGTEVTVLQGELTLPREDGGVEVIRSNQSAQLSENGTPTRIFTYPVILKAPFAGQTFWKKGRGEVNLSWNPSSEKNTYSVVVAKDPEFKNVVFSKETSVPKADFETDERGTFFWKVAALGEEMPPEESPKSNFLVLENSSPRLLNPTNGSELRETEFKWDDETFAERFAIEVASDESFTNPVIQSETSQPNFHAPALPKGPYVWRVRAIDPMRPDAPWSENGRFAVVKPVEPREPAATEADPSLPVEKPVTEASAPPTPIVPPTREQEPALEPEPKPALEPEPKPALEPEPKPEPKPQPTPTIVIQVPTPAPTPVPTPVAQISPQPLSAEKANDILQRFWVWLGAGVNYTYYSQTVPGLAEVNFGNIKSPSWTARIGSMINDRWGMDFGLKDTPGEAQSSSSITVQNGTYHWRSISVEGLYSLSGESAEKDSSLALRFGLQQHQSPFMVPISAGVTEIRDNAFTAGTVGVEYVLYPNKRLRWEFMARYQHPFSASASAGNSFTLNPKFAVDGSIGQVFRLNDRWSLGAYWYGQWHSYSFDYSDGSSGVSFSGDQTLFYSNIDVRLGFEF